MRVAERMHLEEPGSNWGFSSFLVSCLVWATAAPRAKPSPARGAFFSPKLEFPPSCPEFTPITWTGGSGSSPHAIPTVSFTRLSGARTGLQRSVFPAFPRIRMAIRRSASTALSRRCWRIAIGFTAMNQFATTDCQTVSCCSPVPFTRRTPVTIRRGGRGCRRPMIADGR